MGVNWSQNVLESAFGCHQRHSTLKIPPRWLQPSSVIEGSLDSLVSLLCHILARGFSVFPCLNISSMFPSFLEHFSILYIYTPNMYSRSYASTTTSTFFLSTLSKCQ